MKHAGLRCCIPIRLTNHDVGRTVANPLKPACFMTACWVKIPGQTEPLFRGKLNQMLKDGFANQI